MSLSSSSSPPSSSSPEPLVGPELWASRRARWTTPSDGRTLAEVVHARRAADDAAQRRLVDIMREPGAEENQDVWSSGLNQVWRGLVTGVKLKRPLPLPTGIKVLHAGWLRDGTWPEGAAPPSSDAETPAAPAVTTTHAFASSTSPSKHSPIAMATKLLSKLR